MPRTTLHTCPLPISRHVPKLSPQTVSVSDSDILCLVSASPIPNNNKRTKNNTPRPDSRFLVPKQHPEKSPLPLVLPSPYPSLYTPRVTRHNPPSMNPRALFACSDPAIASDETTETTYMCLRTWRAVPWHDGKTNITDAVLMCYSAVYTPTSLLVDANQIKNPGTCNETTRLPTSPTLATST